MVDEILTAAGIPFRHVRFVKPPAGTYAVWMDDVSTDGPDYQPLIYTHEVTVELYADAPDDAAESALEDAIAAAGLQWSKQDRVWIDSEQWYQTVYDFTYIEKKRGI